VGGRVGERAGADFETRPFARFDSNSDTKMA